MQAGRHRPGPNHACVQLATDESAVNNKLLAKDIFTAAYQDGRTMTLSPTAVVALALMLLTACSPSLQPGGDGEAGAQFHADAVGEVGEVGTGEPDSGLGDSAPTRVASDAVDGGALPNDATASLGWDGDSGGIPDTEPADTTSDIDTKDTDTAPESADTAGAPDLPQTWTVVDGCAVPQAPPASAECAAAACGIGTICVGKGACVPNGPINLPGAPTVSKVEAIASREHGSWAVTMITGGFGQWSVNLLVFGGPTPTPLYIVNFPSVPGTWNHKTAVQPLPDGGWLVVGMREVTASGDLSYWSWPLDKSGKLDPDGPYTTNQNPLNTNGKAYLGNSLTRLTALDDGNFLMAWDGAFGGPTSDAVSIRVRYLSPAGLPIGKELVVAPPVWPAMGFAPALAPLDDGSAFVVWHSNQKKGTKGRIRGTILPPLATTTGTVFDVSPAVFALEVDPSIATWQDGVALVGWKAGANPATMGPTHTKLQLLTGTPPAPTGQVHEVDFDAAGAPRFSSGVAVIGNDRAGAVWHNMDPKMQSIYLTRYYRDQDLVDCQKTDVAGPVLPSEQTSRNAPVIASLGQGAFVVVWSTLFYDPSETPILTPRLRYFAY